MMIGALAMATCLLISPAAVQAHHVGGSHQRMNAPNWAGSGVNASVIYFVNTPGDPGLQAAMQYAADYMNQFVNQGRASLIVGILGPEYNGYVRCDDNNPYQPYDYIVPVCWSTALANSTLGLTFVAKIPNTSWTSYARVRINLNRWSGINSDYWHSRNLLLHEMLHAVAFNAGHSNDPGSVLCGTPYEASCYTIIGVQRHMNTYNDQASLFNIYLYPGGENGGGQ